MNTQINYRLILAVICLLGFQLISKAQTPLECNSTLTINSLTSDDFIIPTGISSITIEVRGGDGGNARLDGPSCDVRVRGGSGATVKATFLVSNDPEVEALRPGGRLRVFAAKGGQNADKSCAPTPIGVSAAGGGSSAILYLAPLRPVDDYWSLLAIAGGGGGGTRVAAGIFKIGDGGSASINGTNTGGSSGGTSNACPEFGLDTYVGGGLTNCSSLGEGHGDRMVIDGQGSVTQKTMILRLRDNNFAGTTGGEFRNRPTGGDGFTGGGAGRRGGGGGGGFFGGAADDNFGGGGGGSYLTSLFSPSNTSIQVGSSGGSNNIPTPGRVIITTTASYQANCVQSIEVEAGQSITTADINMESLLACGEGTLNLYDPINNRTGSSLTYSCADIANNNSLVTLQVRDDNNQVLDECSTAVKVMDTTPPVARTKDITLKLNEEGFVLINDKIDNGSSDHCGFTYETSPQFLNCENIGPNEVTFTVTDAAGNSDSETAIVTIQANIKLVTKNTTVALEESGIVFIDAEDVIEELSTTLETQTLQDFCIDFESLKVEPNAFQCGEIGTNTVIVTIKNNSGQIIAKETAIVQVEDVTPPKVFSIPNEYSFGINQIYLPLNASKSDYLIDADDIFYWSDACNAKIKSTSVNGVPVLPNNGKYQYLFTCEDEGVNEISITVQDGAGLTATTTMEAIVDDVIGPVINKKNITLALDENGQASITTKDVTNLEIYDNCQLNDEAVFPNTFDCTNLGENEVLIQAVDIHGNQTDETAIVTIIDNTAPTPNCKDIEVLLDEYGQAEIVDPSIFDNGTVDHCSDVTFSFVDGIEKMMFSCEDLFSPITIEIELSDEYNNKSYCNPSITVKDDIPPVVECKDITLSLNETGKVAYNSIMVEKSSSDNCSTVGFFPLSLLSCGDVGTFTQILTIEDPSGNEATCTGTVTIVDEIPPVAVCNDATVSLDEDGNAYLETATIMNEASQDNCSIESYELNREEFSCEDLGTQEIQLTVYDKGGLAGNCIAVVTVIDEIEPKAVCEDVTVSLDGSGNVILDPNLVAGGSTDNCTVASYVLDWDEFGCEDIGTHAVQLTVIDESGQSSSCTASVTVEEGDELPEGFSTASIGPSSGTVTASACDGYYYLESRQTGSYNIKKGWGEFTYVTLDGDFTFTVEVKSMSSNAVAGIMVRDGNGAESIMGFVGKHGYTMTGGVKLDNNSRFIRKGNARGSRTVVLTVTRVGDIITFTQGRSTLLQLSLDLGNSTQVGLFLSSTNNQDAKASFNNVSYSTNNSNAALQIASRNMSPLRGLEGEQPLELKTFPNPSNGQVNIDIKAFIGNAAILKVQNLNRQVVYSENLGMVYQNQQQINLNELESGLYLLTIESAGQLATSKLVIK